MIETHPPIPNHTSCIILLLDNRHSKQVFYANLHLQYVHLTLIQNELCCYRKHAYVDLASEMDLTKALKLNGEMILDKPMKIAKARVKSEDKVKVKDLALEKKGNLSVLLLDFIRI